MEKLKREFYNRDARIVAHELVGKILVREYDGNKISVRITETEAYIGAVDKASHCYRGVTERNRVMFGPPGHTYVYFIYGMYYCFNVVAEEEGKGSGILIRGAEPAGSMELVSLNRYGKAPDEITKQQRKNMLNGPGKLCKALNITRKENGLDLTKDEIYILNDDYKDFTVERGKRINIDYAEEARDFLWRFTLKRH